MMSACVPIVPSADLEKSLRFWGEGLGFQSDTEMRDGERLIFCMLRRENLCFMLNQRAGDAASPKNDEGIRLYWTPSNLHEAHAHLKRLGYGVSEIERRDYGQTEFFLTDDDGHSHCFGVATQTV